MQTPISLRKRSIQATLAPSSSASTNANSSKRKASDEAVVPEARKKIRSKSKSIVDMAKEMAKKSQEQAKEMAKLTRESIGIAANQSRRRQWIYFQRNRNSKLYQPDIKTIRPTPVQNRQILPCEGACACFLDMKFLITGTPLYIGRKELEFLIIMHKGNIVHTILTGKDADFVVAGTNPDEFKIKKAKKLEIQIIDDGWIFNRLELHNMMDKELKGMDGIEIANDDDFNYQSLSDHGLDDENERDGYIESERLDFDAEDEDPVDRNRDEDNSDSGHSSLDDFIVSSKNIRQKTDQRPKIKKNVSFKSRKTNAKKIDRKSLDNSELDSNGSSSNEESIEERSSSSGSSSDESSSNED